MHNLISIRDICPGDLQEVLRINEESSPGVSRLTAAGVERLTTDANVAWVALADQGVAGYIIGFIGSAFYAGEEFAWFKERGHDFVYVDQVALAPSYRGRGIGSMLYSDHAMECSPALPIIELRGQPRSPKPWVLGIP
jgi:uncharacterized protein